MYICIKKKTKAGAILTNDNRQTFKIRCKYNHYKLLKYRIMKNLTLTQEQVKELSKYIEQRKARSAWDKGVKKYAMDLLYNYSEYIHFLKLELNRETLLNGAADWSQYSWGGCALIYDEEIAERLCNNTELKRTNHGERKPNKNESWLDVQSRALNQAAKILIGSAKYLFVYGKN